MPVLEHIKRVFQTEFGPDFSKLPNRHTTLFVIVQHGFLTIRPMMDVFLELGIPSNHVFMTTKPHTTSPEMLKYFQDTFKTKYVPFQWSTSESTSSSQSRYKHSTAVTHRLLFDKFCDYLLRYPAPAHIQNIIICDEGGKFLNEFINRYNNPDPKYFKKLSDYHVVAIEHTKCGTYSEALARLPFPLINMADSYLKTQIESEFIAKSMFVNLNSILQSIMTSSSMTIGVVGGGNIGREVLDFLLKEYPSTSIIIYDDESSVFSPDKIAEKGWSNVSRAGSRQALFQSSTVILGCTGNDITHKLPRAVDIALQASHVHLISCSSGDSEFQTWLQGMPDYRFEGLADMRDWTMPLNASGDKQLTIHNGGFPINFLVHQPESVPVKEIQITRSMKLAALIQALKLLEVTPYRSNTLTGYMQLDVFYQWEIIQTFYRDLMTTDSPEKRTRVQNQYSRITQQEIAQGSIGSPQPSMNSVLRVPHYVTTNYQIRMYDQLLKQDASITILVIHGTTGSGKTTLAQHYFQKQRIQAPENLSRVLLAETMTQWRSSLGEWAEELFPELNDLLKAEKDPQQQERMVDQHLQKALRRKKWCIVIDNWDQKQVHVGKIQHIFLNEEIDVGTGTLLMTTQGKSNFEAICSLDLSNGFAPDESRGLLIKVMNLEEELAIAWEALGDEVDLQALTAFLNHLPLAVVIAGSYLKWENKSRQSERKALCTFAEYQTMLDQQVTELMRIYDEELGDKGRVPRDQSREEFKRLKTQEAAVALSLRKAIQTESANPNMNLWQLLCFCGFLASDGIPQQLLKDYIAQILPEDEREIYETFFELLLSEAQKYSLLQFENRQSAVDSLQSLHMHRVIQKVLRDIYWPKILYTTKCSHELCSSISISLLKIFGPATDNHDLYISNEYFPHIESWNTHCKNIISPGYINIHDMSLKYCLMSFYCLTGRLHLIKDIFKEKSEIELNIKDKSFFWMTILVNNFQSFFQSAFPSFLKAFVLGDFREMIKPCSQFLSIAISFYGTVQCTQAAKAMQALSLALNYSGCYKEAEAIARQSLEIMMVHDETPMKIQVASSQYFLSSILLNLGHYKEAKSLAQRSLAIFIAHHGTEKILEISRVQIVLGMILEKLGDYINAEKFLHQAIETLRSHFSKSYIDMASAEAGLALVFERSLRHQEAEKLYLHAISILIEQFGSEQHPLVAIVYGNFSITLNSLGLSEKAEIVCRKSLEIVTKQYGCKHFLTAAMQNNMAFTLEKLGQFQEAEHLYQQALPIVVSHYGTEICIDVARIQRNIALILSDLGYNTAATELYQKSLSTMIQHYGADTHLEVVKIQRRIALVRNKLNTAPTDYVLSTNEPKGTQYFKARRENILNNNSSLDRQSYSTFWKLNPYVLFGAAGVIVIAVVSLNVLKK